MLVNRECPICGKHMNHLRPHLTGYHQVGLSRLDRHLADLHQLPPNEVDEQMLLCKQQLIVDRLPLDSWLPPHPPLPPCLSIQWIALPLSSPVQCMTGDLSCTALEKRVEGLELAVRQLQATMSLQHDSSTATPQATSSAALASPSPGTTHSPDRETPSTPRSPASPASLQGYTWDEYLNTGPTVAQSTQPQPSVPFSHLFFLEEDLHSLSPTYTEHLRHV
ncbi:unnamed protein product [Arctogadus glacialis]